MIPRLLVPFILTVFIVTSCAPKAGLVKKEGPVPEKKVKRPVLPPPPPPPEAKQPPRVEPVRIEEKDNEKYIILNFENTDIQTIISTFGELLEINYILTPGITGSVTVQSYKKFPVDDLFQIFQTLLEINGLTAVRDGSFYRIVPIDTAKQHHLEVEKGGEPVIQLDSSFITQLIPLENVNASDAANILRNLMPRGTDLFIYEPANMLIVTAQPRTLVKFMKILEAIDISDTESESIRTFVYYVENGDAKKLEEILKTIYAEKGATTRRVTSPTAAAKPTRTTTRRRTTTTPTVPSLPGFLGEITITAYEDINALIIKTTPRAYLSLLDVLKKIDVPPKQVLIDMLIAQVTLSDSEQLGIEWLLESSRGDTFGFVSSSVDNPPIITSEHPGSGDGLFAAVVSGVTGTTAYQYIISAIAANTRLKVLASPHILTVDNKDAEIKIGREIPTATSTTTSDEGVSTSQQIEYRTVGTILSVTPHITEKGNVSMELSIERSDTGSTTTLGTGTFPDFTTNKATTPAVVKDGHTLILAGLIEEKNNWERSGIPFLSRIPILGYLFGATSEQSERTELIIMITPHVVSNQEEADALTRKFQNRITTIRRDIPELEEGIQIGDEKEKKEEEEKNIKDKDEKEGQEEEKPQEALTAPAGAKEKG
jgi:general secretion pathway protein D